MKSNSKITCKACFNYGEQDVRVGLREVEYGIDNVLANVECGGTCGSVIHYYQHGRAGMSVLKNPMVIGYEFVGVVQKASAGSGLRPEQLIAVNPSQSCKHRAYCLEGKQHRCATMQFMGSAQFFPHVNG